MWAKDQGEERRDAAGVVESPGSAVRGGRAVLIRPDGYVAWVARNGRTDLDALRAALTTWLGPGR
ncbi:MULTISPECIES: hypothetical protein [unclassified Nonomuraea]|uniref:aromatic-ring hydroxylase C-terminal domain-containing protein n=1 Tax=unclassified Nonomuraea TaxID=2593643 RepID=UPI0033DA63E2